MKNNLDFGKLYKYLDKLSEGGWYNIRPLLTYRKPALFITGERGTGKSTSPACMILLNYLILGGHFIFVKERFDDIPAVANGYFDNAAALINEKLVGMGLPKIIEVKYWQRRFSIATKLDDKGKPVFEEFGIARALEKQNQTKGLVDDKTNILFFDEFISDDPESYIGGNGQRDLEWTRLLSLFITVDRKRGERYSNSTMIICAANKSTVYCPILIGAGVIDYLQDGQKITSPKNKMWVWEDTDKVEVEGQPVEESFGYLLADEQTKRVSYQNVSLDDGAYIKKPDIATYVMSFRLRGVDYGIYADKEGYWYISEPKEGYRVIALDPISHNATDFELIASIKDNNVMCKVVEQYKKGRLYFGTGAIKNALLKYLKFMP